MIGLSALTEKLNPYMLWIKIAAIAIAAITLLAMGWRLGANSVRADMVKQAQAALVVQQQAIDAQHTADIEQATKDLKPIQAAADDAQRVKLERDALLLRVAALQAHKQLTIEVPHANACPTIRLSPAVRLCLNAAASGGAEACPAPATDTVPTGM